MCAFVSSARRSTMLLRRYKLPTEFAQTLFRFPIEKSFSTSSVLDADKNSSDRKSNFLSKLKNIFNKSENISHEVHDKTVDRQSILLRSTSLKNQISNRQINPSSSLRKENDVNEEFVNVIKEITHKNEGNAILTMNDSLFNFNLNNYLPTRTISFFDYKTYTKNLNNHVEIKNERNLIPQTSRPPIREPNMPEKQVKKEEKKKKKEKKPVVRTYDHFVKRNEHFLKINIGRSTQYIGNFMVTRNPINYNKNMWINKRFISSGRNVLFFKETTGSKPTKDSNEKTHDVLNSVIPPDNPILTIEKNNPITNDKINDTNMIQAEKVTDGANAIEELESTLESEIIAWKNIIEKSKSIPEKKIEQELVELQLEKVSIRPEPPIPKLDIEMVRPLNDEIRNEEELDESVNSDRKSMRSRENIRVGNINEKIDNRKYHTLLFDKKNDRLEKITITKNYSKSHSPSNTDSESSERSNNENQEVTKTKVQSVQNVFARSSVRESENTDEGTSNESKRSSLSANFQSGINKQEDKTAANFTQTLDAVDGKRVISLNHSNQGDARLPLSVNISSRPKQEQTNDPKLNEEESNTNDSSKDEYPYSSMNVSTYDEYPYTFFDESYSEETKYTDSKEKLNQNDDDQNMEEQETMKELNSKDLEEDENEKMEVEVRGNDEFIRIPGDPYPYSREHFNKWRLPRKKTFEDTILKTLQSDQNRKRISEDIGAQGSKILGTSSIQHTEDSKTSSIQKEKQPIREMSHDSHVHDKFYRATMFDNIEDPNRLKKIKKFCQPKRLNERKFCVSSLDQQIIPECLRRGVDGLSRREFHRWTRYGFRTRNSQNRKESEDELNAISKNEKIDRQSFDVNKNNDQFVKINYDTQKKDQPVSEKTNYYRDGQPQYVFDKTETKENAMGYKIRNLIQEHQFNKTATSVKKGKELQMVTRLETKPSMTKEEFKRIYEMKNYSYLRTEEIKDTQPIKMKENKPKIKGFVYVDDDNDAN